MANESTFALISDLLPDIWEGALFYARHSFVMPRLVRVYSDQRGMVPRKISEYVETAVQDNLGETTDLTTVAFDRNLKQTLTPKEIGKQFVITDRRVESDLESVLSDASQDLGYTMGKKMEIDLLSEIAGFTGGIFGSEATAMTMEIIFAGRARLEANGIAGPYFTVLHPYQYFDLWANYHNLSNPAPLNIRDQAVAQYFVTQVADVQIIVHNLVPLVVVANEVQTITVTGTPTGGTFKLKFAEQETATIAFNASAATVDAALEALPNIGVGGVSSTGGPLPGTAVTVTFDGATVTGQNVPTLVLSNNSLTGGTSPTVTIATTTQGANYARGGIWSREALALDLRRGIRIEPERDASMRWTELNATSIYAASEWRAERGVILKSDASTPLV